jgi:predicted nucleic acid-binding protein
MIAYVDSSVLLRIILEQPDPLRELAGYEELVTSALTQVECLRAVDNAWIRGDMDAEESTVRRLTAFAKLKRFVRVRPSRSILARAEGPFPTLVAALDGIHVATALIWRERRAPDLVFATHDRRQARAAAALDFEVLGA